jgi:hypothetical protein
MLNPKLKSKTLHSFTQTSGKLYVYCFFSLLSQSRPRRVT